MSYFKAKVCQIRFPLGELTAHYIAVSPTVPLTLPPSLVRYTNRPFGRRRRNTKRLTVVLLSAAKQPCQNAIRFVRLPLWRTSNADELMTIMCALELGRLYKTTRFGADKANRK